jgi:dihydrofolate synthase/folylpolyglutamate synthase
VYLSTLYEWLNWIGSVHQTEIDLGLERIREVAARLGVLTPRCPVVTVGGTNGKGSIVAGLAAIYRAAGYHVGTFTSPYLLIHNEEVRVDGTMASDASFLCAFEKIEAARAELTLTPFEYHTLAAFLIFQETELDIIILEVGLGGRLDAVNMINPDVAVVASIGIDHVAWLGDTREKIAVEKAGIFRHDKPAICGDPSPPVTLAAEANKIGARFIQQGKDFHWQESEKTWSWQAGSVEYGQLPLNTLLTQNMASVLMAITSLQATLPVSEDAIRLGLKTVTLSGRIQVIAEKPITEILDVAHNPAAAVRLAEYLAQQPCSGKTRAVFSMLDDKDIEGTLAVMKAEVDAWYIASLEGKRAASLDKFKKIFPKASITSFQVNENIVKAYEAARAQATPGDRIIIFGSFYVVADIMRLKQLVP